MIFTTPLSIIGRFRGCPCFIVQGTVLPLWLAILEQDVSVEETTYGAAVQMLDVILGFRLASSSTTGSAEGLTVIEMFVGNIRVPFIAITWRVDCYLVQVCSGVSWHSVDLSVEISVGSGNDNMEVISPLSVVVRGRSVNRGTPENAFDDGGRRRIWAAWSRNNAWASLEEDVEPNTTLFVRAFVCTRFGVIRRHRLVPHVCLVEMSI